MEVTYSHILTSNHKSWNKGQRSRSSSRSPEAFRITLRKVSIDLQPVVWVESMRRHLPSTTGFHPTWMPFLMDFDLLSTLKHMVPASAVVVLVNHLYEKMLIFSRPSTFWIELSSYLLLLLSRFSRV